MLYIEKPSSGLKLILKSVAFQDGHQSTKILLELMFSVTATLTPTTTQSVGCKNIELIIKR